MQSFRLQGNRRFFEGLRVIDRGTHLYFFSQGGYLFDGAIYRGMMVYYVLTSFQAPNDCKFSQRTCAVEGYVRRLTFPFKCNDRKSRML